MSEKTENLSPVKLSVVAEADPAATAGTPEGKMPFVEPEVSPPVDVLEATTFFQRGNSGDTGPPTPP